MLMDSTLEWNVSHSTTLSTSLARHNHFDNDSHCATCFSVMVPVARSLRNWEQIVRCTYSRSCALLSLIISKLVFQSAAAAATASHIHSVIYSQRMIHYASRTWFAYSLRISDSILACLRSLSDIVICSHLMKSMVRYAATAADASHIQPRNDSHYLISYGAK